MSLIGHLDNKTSPLRQWFQVHLDDRGARELVKEVNDQLALITPIVTDGAVPSLVGTAFDYGFRWLLGPMDRECVAYHGASAYINRMKQVKTLHMEQAETLCHDIINIGDATTDPIVRAQCCIVLAWFEAMSRAGAATPELSAVLSSAQASVQHALDATPTPSVDDVVTLLATVPDVWGDDMLRPFQLNPSFESSYLVEGADADWITEHTLYECKCSRQKRPHRRKYLLQLLSYILMDTNDALLLHSAGWYYVRQQKRIVYPLPELIERALGTTNLQELRHDFYETLISIIRRTFRMSQSTQ